MSFQRVADILPTVLPFPLPNISTLQQRSNGEAETQWRQEQTLCRNFHGKLGSPDELTNCCETETSLQLSSECSSPDFNSIGNSGKKGRRRALSASRPAWYQKVRYQRARCDRRLKPWQVEGLFEADRFARTIGRPLNLFVTIAWLLTEGVGIDFQTQFRRAMKCLDEWFRRKGIPVAWIYAHENPDNRRPNTHLLIYVPVEVSAEFLNQCNAWFRAEPLGLHARRRNGPADRCLSYMIKGTDFVTARKHGGRAHRQGTIPFKRAGWSQSLGENARSNHFNAPTPVSHKISY